jgi:hypothetical protein
VARGEAVGWGTAQQLTIIDNPPGRTVALGLTQPPTETSTGNIFWGVKAAGVQGCQR